MVALVSRHIGRLALREPGGPFLGELRPREGRGQRGLERSELDPGYQYGNIDTVCVGKIA